MTSLPFAEWVATELAKLLPAALIKNLVFPAGLTLIAGAPKAGKSYVALLMAMAMASNRAFGPIFPTKASKVLYIELEGTPRSAAKRAMALAVGMGIAPAELANLRFETLRRLKLRDPEAVERLIAHIQEHEIECVILDTLRESFTGDENSSEATAQYFDTLKAIRDATGVAAILVHHASKQGGKYELELSMNITDPIRGSGNISASADVLMMVQRGFLMSADGSHYSDEEESFIYVGGKNIGPWWVTEALDVVEDEEGEPIRAVLSFGDKHKGLGMFRITRPPADPRKRY